MISNYALGFNSFIFPKSTCETTATIATTGVLHAAWALEITHTPGCIVPIGAIVTIPAIETYGFVGDVGTIVVAGACVQGNARLARSWCADVVVYCGFFWVFAAVSPSAW